MTIAISDARFGQLHIEELKELIAIGPAVIYTAAPYYPFRTTFISPNSVQQLGYEPSAFISDPNFRIDHIHPDDRVRIGDLAVQSSEDDHHVTEYRFRTPDDTWRWIRDEYNVVRNGDGAPVRIVGACVDISEQKKLEMTLRRAQGALEEQVESRTASLEKTNATLRAEIKERQRAETVRKETEIRFRDFAEIASDWLWETDAALTFTYVSAQSADIVGTRPEAMVGKTWLTLDGLILDEAAQAQYQALLETQKCFRGARLEFRTSEDETRRLKVNGRPVLDADGHFGGYRGSATEITAEVRALNEAEDARANLLDAINSSSDGFAVYDGEDRLILWNHVYEGFFGKGSGLLERGRTFEENVRDAVARDMYPAEGATDDAVDRRLRHFRQADGSPMERQTRDGRCFLVTERRTKTGGTVSTTKDVTHLKRQNSELTESRDELRQLTDNLPVMVSYIDENTRYSFMNDTGSRWLAHQSQDIVGKKVSEILPPLEYQKLRGRLRDALAGNTVEFEETMTYPDGNVRHVVINYIPDRGESGRPQGFFSLVVDITDRVNAEAALRASEQRVHDFALAASDWFWETDAAHRFVFASEQSERITGRPDREILGLTPWGLANADVTSDPWCWHEQDLAARRPFRDFRISCERPDREIRYASVSGIPVFDPDGAFKGYRGASTDITEQVKAERTHEAVLAVQQRFMAALNAIPVGVMLYDADDCLVFFNRTYGAHADRLKGWVRLGVRFEDLMNDLVATGDVPIAAGEQEAWKAKRLHQHRNPGSAMDMALGDGWYEVGDYRTPDGGTMVIVNDITERRRKATLTTRDELLDIIGHFAGGLAKSYDNALIILSLRLKILEQRLVVSDSMLPHIKAMTDAIQRTNTLNQRVLGFAGKLELEPDVTHLDDFAMKALPALRRLLGEEIAIAVETDNGLWPVRVDPFMLAIAVEELVGNARNVMPEGGTIEIRLSNVSQDALPGTIDGAAAGDYVLLAFSDDGPGMAPTVAARAFDPFFVLEEARDGAGLGLAMVYGFVRQSGGLAAIDSEPGGRTTVRLYFPRMAEHPSAIA